MKKEDVLHVSLFSLLLELLHGFFLVLCGNVDGALLAHKTVSVHRCDVLIVVVLLLIAGKAPPCLLVVLRHSAELIKDLVHVVSSVVTILEQPV